jgi:hypothetical protein
MPLITTSLQRCPIFTAADQPAVVHLNLPYAAIRVMRRLNRLALEDLSPSEDDSSSSDSSSDSDNSSTIYVYDISDYYSNSSNLSSSSNSESSDSSDD